MNISDPQIRSLIASIFIVIAAAPIGRFLVMRRMSLVGDAMGHSLLPGATLGAILGQNQPWAISIGAALSGSLLFAIASRLTTILKLSEDTVFAIFYLGAISTGVLIAAKGGHDVHLEDLLFGNIEKADNFVLIFSLIAGIVCFLGVRLIYKPLLFDTIEGESRGYEKQTSFARLFYYVLLTILIVGAFQTMGALLAIGVILLPAICSGFYFNTIREQIVLAALIGLIAVLSGTFISARFDISQSAISILILVVLTLVSAFHKVKREA